jgi:hypothetical protein
MARQAVDRLTGLQVAVAHDDKKIRWEGNRLQVPGYTGWQFLDHRLFFLRSISVSIPSAAFQFETACGKYFFCSVAAFGALDRLGIHPHQFFGNMSTFTLKFVDRHRAFLSD